jgi:putative membrane-bound dehydrogenase-like protein
MCIKIGLREITVLLMIFILSCTSGKKKEIIESPFVQILFLGHESTHHNSEKYVPMLASYLVQKGIHISYTTDLDDLNPDNLNKYSGLAIYANHEEINAAQEKALLDFVSSGKGLIPIHCASACFKNSEEYIKMVGGQFKSHGSEIFQARLTKGESHQIKGIKEFKSWDETYVHHKINPDISILTERIDSTHHEPWTWTNTYGQGRVFYTASGHDERTWSHPGFHELLEKGILWAVGDEQSQKLESLELPKHEYSEAKIPNYEKRDPAPKLQKPLSPKAAMQLTQVPVGFELELFASEPDIINPVAMSWDEQGRLWVIETVDYPNTVRNEDGIGDDRIKICEDTDNDGKADKFTVFAENLNLPTGLVFSDGGILVAQAPDILFLKDADGDDKADIRKSVMTGWGTFDTHAVVSNLKYGFDNKIWATVGYSGFDGEVNGIPTKFKQGIVRFNPDGSNLEQMTKTSNNTWGLGFSENFDVFASTANNTHSVFMGIPNSYLEDKKGLNKNGSAKIDGHYAMHPISDKIRQVDVFGGFTAASGHNLYTARDFPKEYWNKVAFVCEPTGRLIHNAILQPEGSDFIEKDGWNLMASNDNWFGPVHAEVGPDGAVWVADWYNFIIQHNPTPPGFKNGAGNAHINPLRDKKHGRIYKLKYKGAENYSPIRLSINQPKELLKALYSDNLFWRLNAQRLLVEGNHKEVVPELLKMIRDLTTDAIGINGAAIHALWTLKGLNMINAIEKEVLPVVISALGHPSPGVRKAAIQVMPREELSDEIVISSNILEDTDKQTQLAALLVVSEIPSSKIVGERLYALSLSSEIVDDIWLSQALYIAAVQHKSDFIGAIRAHDPDLYAEGRDSNSEFERPYDTALDDSEWSEVKLPGFWEATEIGAIDGTLWFRKEIDISDSQSKKMGTMNLGPIDDSDETFLNGVKIGGFEAEPGLFRTYKIPKGLLRSGKNVIAVKVVDTGGDGGFSVSEKDFQLLLGTDSIGLSGEWKYWIQSLKGTISKNRFDQHNSIPKVFLKNYLSSAQEANNGVLPSGWPYKPKVVQLATIVNEMKYDLSKFEVEPGEAVEIRFNNNDFMQHNLLIIKEGSLDKVGAAADILATDPLGADKNYVPDLPEILEASALVDPNSEVILRFYAPEKEGDYPFVCTFPGHWKIMNGIMKVVKK